MRNSEGPLLVVMSSLECCSDHIISLLGPLLLELDE